MPPHKVFYFSHAPKNVYAIIREEVPAGFELVTLCDDSDEERLEKIADCEVVIVAAKPMSAALVEAATRLKLIHHQGVGYQDTVATEALKEKNIALALTPAGTTIGVAEHTVLLTLAVCKRLPYADNELRQGRWHINSLRPYSFELFGRTVGYLGMGPDPFETDGFDHLQTVKLVDDAIRLAGLPAEHKEEI
jgi:phosphoglycerate dehydrogenase-like enzyme